MKVIANPRAGHGRNQSNLRSLESLLQSSGQSFEILVTRFPRHAEELTRNLIRQGCRRIVVMGGDGTIGEVVNAAVSETEEVIELGIIPMGTGNDVARSLGIPSNNLPAALEVLRTGRSRSIDVGWERDRCFISVLGYGFPVLVASETNRMKWLKGSPAFFVAVYKALHRMKPVAMKVVLDDREVCSLCTSVMVQNSPYTGGGLLMAPGASMDDGLLDVVVVGEIARLDLMFNFPKVYKGRHLEHPSFRLYRTRRVRIETELPQEKMFDGDIQGRSPVEVKILPRRIQVIVPDHE